MLKTLANDLYACGKTGPPKQIVVLGKEFRLCSVLKHDFFAATGLYESAPGIGPSSFHAERVVLKIDRLQPLLGFPMAWLGRMICRHEISTLEKLDGISNVPKVMDHFEKNGFVYRYIEGRSLDERPALPECFFDELARLVEKMHQKGIVYLDMNKRGNILLGDDGHAYMIDFQISQYLAIHSPVLGWFYRRIHRACAGEDYYHLYKHKRKLQEHLLTAEQFRVSKHRSWRIYAHRFITRPFREVRRAFLRMMYSKDLLLKDPHLNCTPENDPARFANKTPSRLETSNCPGLESNMPPIP